MTTMSAAAIEPTAAMTTAGRRFAASIEASERFFRENADAVALACEAMALRFQTGGRLLVRGDGAQRSDAAHVVVEFVHPVIVGKRALPAIALPGESATEALVLLPVLGGGKDMLMILCAGAPTESDRRLIARSRSEGMLTLALTGTLGAGETIPSADFVLCVLSDDACVVQEVHEMLYHVLWELVHVFFEHRAVAS